MTTLSTLLARWSTKSNRRRVVETIAQLLPWLVAGTVVTLLAFECTNLIVGVATAVVAGAAAIAAGVVMAKRVWHGPASIARQLDHERHTADLLQTAFAIEARGPRDDEPFEPVVLARAHAFVPTLAATAVAPLRLRTSAYGGLVAVGVIAVFVFVDMTPARSSVEAKTPAATHVLGERDKAQAKAVGDAIDALSKDKTLSPKVREKIDRAKDALHRATLAKTGTAALAALSEASRELDEAAKEMSKSRVPDPSALAKMSRQELASELAKMAKMGDQAQLSSLAREALRRSAMSPEEAAKLAEAIKQAIAKQGGDPSGKPREGASGADQRMQQLAAAADQMARNDLAGTKSDLGDMTRSTAGATQPRDARTSSLDSARRAVAQMHAAQRSAMNGQQQSDQRADAARAAAMAKAGEAKPGTGSGSGRPGAATAGTQPGMFPGAPQPGAAPDGTPQLGDAPPGGALSVLQGPNLPGNPGGAQGTSGSPGAKAPSGATDIETSAAEEVNTPPPVSPDGVIRAIREHSTGEHTSEAFEPVRDHYQAIAEAAMHRDQIPLTRRDFIQRYFEALRDHAVRDEPDPVHSRHEGP